jgi:hypothetical protein
MRKIVYCGLLGTLLGTAAFTWATVGWKIRSSSAMEQHLHRADQHLAATQGEPEPPEPLRREPADPTPAGQPLEVIDLLRSDASANLAEEEEPPCAPVPQGAFAEGLASREAPADSKTIEERLKCVLQSFLNHGEHGRAAVDTLEFRATDAKKGEFDRIPF